MRGPLPATSDDEIEIRSVHEASEAGTKTEREFKILSNEELAKLTAEEKTAYGDEFDLIQAENELDEDDDAGRAALRARYKRRKLRRSSSPSGQW